MSANSTIEWTDATWNPTRGCSRVSPGCERCYAERVAGRFGGTGQPYQGLVRKTPTGYRWTGEARLVPEKLVEPLRWRTPHLRPPPSLDWVIAGSESGTGARPAELDWFRSVRDQCAAAGVAFFFKQWAGPEVRRPGDVVSLPVLDGCQHVEWPR
jgi:protein gp37